MSQTKTSLVTAVEVRRPDEAALTLWEIPVKVERRDDLTALVFHTPSELTSVTVLLSGGDRIALIELLGGTYDPDYHH
jgi:hypothetical protein